MGKYQNDDKNHLTNDCIFQFNLVSDGICRIWSWKRLLSNFLIYPLFVCFFEDTTLFRFYTLVSPNPLRSTLAELKVDGVTRACNLRIPLLRTISSHGYSVAFKLRNFTLKWMCERVFEVQVKITCWKNEISGHNRRTSLSICSKNSLSLKNVLQVLSGPSLNGWSDTIEVSAPGGMAISSENITCYLYF